MTCVQSPKSSSGHFGERKSFRARQKISLPSSAVNSEGKSSRHFILRHLARKEPGLTSRHLIREQKKEGGRWECKLLVKEQKGLFEEDVALIIRS